MMKNYTMIDVGQKPITQRIAVAEGSLKLGAEAFERVKTNSLPKGDALSLCELAGIQGAKNASQTMLLCHPLGLDQVQIISNLIDETTTIHLTAIVSAHAKTGVEMEALAGVTAALLNLWDLIKMIDPHMTIGDVRLLAKKGGKGGLWLNPDGVPDWVRALVAPAPQKLLKDRKAVIITLSDRAHLGVYEDRSGPKLCAILKDHGAEIMQSLVLPDEPEALKNAVLEAIKTHDPHLIITTGGTGIAPRDLTPEALLPLFDRTIDGIGERLRSDGARFTPLSWASRAVGGLIGQTLVITLPGNPKAVSEGMEALLPELLPHLLRIARNETI